MMASLNVGYKYVRGAIKQYIVDMYCFHLPWCRLCGRIISTVASLKYCLSEVRIQNWIMREVYFEDTYKRDCHAKEPDCFFWQEVEVID